MTASPAGVVREALEHTAGIIVVATSTLRALPVAPFEPLRDVQWAAIVTLVDADRPRGGKPVDLRQVASQFQAGRIGVLVAHRHRRWPFSEVPTVGPATGNSPPIGGIVLDYERDGCLQQKGCFGKIQTNMKTQVLHAASAVLLSFAISCGRDEVKSTSDEVKSTPDEVPVPNIVLASPIQLTLPPGAEYVMMAALPGNQRDRCLAALEFTARNIYQESGFSTFEEFEKIFFSLSREEISGQKDVSNASMASQGQYAMIRGVLNLSKSDESVRNELLRLKTEFERNSSLSKTERHSLFRSTVNPEAFKEFNKCTREGLILDTINEGEVEFTIVITFRPTSSTDKPLKVAANPRLNNLKITGENRLKKGVVIGLHESSSIQVKRDNPEKSSGIFIEFEGRAGIGEDFAPIAKRRFSDSLPIGTIIESVVSGDDFVAKFDNPQYKDDMAKRLWVPADGRSVAGSSYVAVTGMSRVPDLRGVFMRGLNTFSVGDEKDDVLKISDEQKDPDDKRTVGQLQQSALQHHAHSFIPLLAFKRAGQGGVVANGGDGHVAESTGDVKIDADKKTLVDKETRPTNVAVFRYIKIND